MQVSPPHWTIYFSLFWLTLVFVAFSDTATDLLIFLMVSGIFALWGVAWLIRAIVLLVETIRSHSQDDRARLARRQKLHGLGIEATAIVLSLVLVFLNIPLNFRLRLSEPALTSYIQEVQASRPAPQMINLPRQVGLFQIKEVEVLNGDIVRVITADDFVDHAGLVYSPQQQPPPIRGEDTYRHLYGPWWHWHQSW